MKIEDAAGHGIRGFREKPDNATRLAVVGEEGYIRHLINLRGRTDISEGHLSVWPGPVFTQKQINFIGLFRVLMFLPGSQDRETAIETLRTLPAVRMECCHVVDPGAASSISDQTAAPVHRYPFDDFSLGHPSKRIVYGKGPPEHRGKDATKARQDLRVSGSGSPSADDLSNRRQVQTYHAILEETDTVFVKQPCRRSPECCEQKGSYPVRRLSAEAGVDNRPDGNVKHTAGAKPAA